MCFGSGAFSLTKRQLQYLQRRPTACGIGCRGAQEFCELMSRARVETAIGAARQARDFAKGLLGDGIEAFLEHEGGHAEKPELSGRMTQVVEFLFHRIADEDKGLDLSVLRLALGMSEDLAELRVAAAAFNALHQRAQPFRLRYPTRGAALPEAAVIDQLHVQPADRRCLAKHVGLQPTGRVPGGLATHGRVEREDEAAPSARLCCRRELLHTAQKSIDLGARIRRRRGAAAIRCWPVRAIIGHGSRRFNQRWTRPLRWPYPLSGAMPPPQQRAVQHE